MHIFVSFLLLNEAAMSGAYFSGAFAEFSNTEINISRGFYFLFHQQEQTI